MISVLRGVLEGQVGRLLVPALSTLVVGIGSRLTKVGALVVVRLPLQIGTSILLRCMVLGLLLGVWILIGVVWLVVGPRSSSVVGLPLLLVTLMIAVCLLLIRAVVLVVTTVFLVAKDAFLSPLHLH